MASGGVALDRAVGPVDRIGVALVTVAAVLSGLSGVWSRMVLDHGLSAAQLAQIRLTLCATVLLAVYRGSVMRVIRARGGRAELVVLGVVGMAGLQLCYLAALRRLDVALALLLLYLAPALVAAWQRVAHGRRQRPLVWACMAALVVGLAVALGVGPESVGAVSATGVLAGFGAAACWAYYMVQTERLGHRHTGPAFLAVAIALGAISLTVVAPLWALPWDLLDDRVTTMVAGGHPPVLLLVIAVVLLGTLAPFILFLDGLRRIGAGGTSMLASLEPIAGAGAAWVLLSQELTVLQVLGGLVVVVAAALSQRRPPSQRAGLVVEQERPELVRRPG